MNLDPIYAVLTGLASAGGSAAWAQWFTRRRQRSAVEAPQPLPVVPDAPPAGPRQEPYVKCLEIHNEDDRATLYQHCIDHIEGSTEAIFKIGRGISRFSGKNDELVDRVVLAERRAVHRGVTIDRIQTGRHVIGRWAPLYSELVRDWPNRVRVFEDFQEEMSMTIAVIDPDGDHPIVELLTEKLVVTPDGGRFRTGAAVFVHGMPELAQSLKLQHIERATRLEHENRRMTPKRIKVLGYDHLYFAYGTDVDKREMTVRAQGSTLVGWATLKDWRRDYWIPNPEGSGCWPGIVRDANDEVFGALYAISSEDKAALDMHVGRPYQPIEVKVECGDGAFDAITYIPREPYTRSGRPDAEILDRMIDAARAEGVMQLWRQLVADKTRWQDPPTVGT